MNVINFILVAAFIGILLYCIINGFAEAVRSARKDRDKE